MNTAREFWSMVNRRGLNQCWPWKGGTRGRKVKYGSCWWRGKHEGAHRIAYRLVNGRIPKMRGTDKRGTCVLHSCDFGICCNPRHLFAGTHKRNMEDKCAKRRDTSKWKTHCRNGHRRTPQNLYTSKKGLRACQTCHRLRERERQRRLRGNKEQRKS